MHRSTVAGKVRPSKKTTEAVTPLKYHCYNHPPFENREYCLFSLKVNVAAAKKVFENVVPGQSATAAAVVVKNVESLKLKCCTSGYNISFHHFIS